MYHCDLDTLKEPLRRKPTSQTSTRYIAILYISLRSPFWAIKQAVLKVIIPD